MSGDINGNIPHISFKHDTYAHRIIAEEEKYGNVALARNQSQNVT